MQKWIVFAIAFLVSALPCLGQTDVAWNLEPIIGSANLLPADGPDAHPYDPTSNLMQEVQQNVKDIHFDFAQSNLLPEDRSVLQSDAQWLKDHPDVFVTIEGDADERGGVVYNLALSEDRATTARDALVAMGVPSDQIIFSEGWGKLYPVCDQSDDACWSQNRRAHFAAW